MARMARAAAVKPLRPGAVVAWSGGKDGALALAKAAAAGARVIGLVNFVSAADSRVAFQGLPAKLISLQAKALGLRLFQEELVAIDDPELCRAHYARFGRRLRDEEGVAALISGHIGEADVQGPQVAALCRELGLALVAPLAGKTSESVFADFLDSGMEAVIAKVDAERLSAAWLGKPVDESFLAALRRGAMDVCGDRGEYHTLVVNGPFFRRPIEYSAGGVIDAGRDKLLDIRSWRLGRPRQMKKVISPRSSSTPM